MSNYELVDSGEHRKLERFGKYLIDRPAPLAIWPKSFPSEWKKADARLLKREEGNLWEWNRLPPLFEVEHEGLLFGLKATDFGHLGVFPEHGLLWKEVQNAPLKGKKLLNLFAYTGGMTLAALKAGAEVCHVDASKSVVVWAKENCERNGLSGGAARFIIDDVTKFLKREEQRGRKYDAIVLDPPSFGRGQKGESFKIEKDLLNLLALCRKVLSDKPLFVLLSCHTPKFSKEVLSNLLKDEVGCLKVESGELSLPGKISYPSGSFAKGFFA